MARIIPVAPFDYVVFGGTGDLALRKLMPSLYCRDKDGQIPAGSRIIAVSRSDLDDQAYRDRVAERVEGYLKEEFDRGSWSRFAERLHHVQIDVSGDTGWDKLKSLLASGGGRVPVFYLATAPDLFGPICRKLQNHEMVTEEARVVLEKPLGHDLASARAINEEVGAVFAEPRIFRIDHYLGKETVQNLLALRFANALFEPRWHSGAVDHVQITVAESIGVEGRGGYYDKSGALRDMVQNHILQLLCLVAMEPPVSFNADAVRDEKLKVLRALKPITADDVQLKTVRGQYRAGAIDGVAVPGYLDEITDGVSSTETFVAIKTEVVNWRWAGVPFYLRTGKRLSGKTSEIVIQFRPVPHSIFPADAGQIMPNRLVVRLQPNEGMKLHLMSKDPGPGGLRLRDTILNLSFAEAFKTRYPDAYERLLMDVVRGNPTLFMRRDEVETAWAWAEPILAGWAMANDQPKPYTAGTWGPAAAIALIERDGRTWHEEEEAA